VSCPLPRVLVIDDQPDVRTMVSMVLRVNHFEVVEAASAAAGLQAFENSNFELAIVDIFLQGTNGFEVIMKMRERVPDFPIVAISGMTMYVCKSRFAPPNLPSRSKSQPDPGRPAPETSRSWKGSFPDGAPRIGIRAGRAEISGLQAEV
jgi:hypothetical protein